MHVVVVVVSEQQLVICLAKESLAFSKKNITQVLYTHEHNRGEEELLLRVVTPLGMQLLPPSLRYW